MGLIRMLFWFVLFVASTFAFTVLFEHGPEKYGENAKKEWQALQKYYKDKSGKGEPKKEN